VKVIRAVSAQDGWFTIRQRAIVLDAGSGERRLGSQRVAKSDRGRSRCLAKARLENAHEYGANPEKWLDNTGGLSG
jgi:hypothetical protein